ncbi:MAG: hypothetical protein FWD18_10340 [Micrococcales bacterium]|nr:hypothetical protein [Micrococcales bacterium]
MGTEDGTTGTPDFDPGQFIDAAKDTLTIRRVYGEAYEHEGTLVIPVAKVAGCLGTGVGRGGDDDGASAEGRGGGFGALVRPLGVFVVDEKGVHWQPAIDVNRAVLVGQLVFGTVLVVGIVAAKAAGVLRRPGGRGCWKKAMTRTLAGAVRGGR